MMTNTKQFTVVPRSFPACAAGTVQSFDNLTDALAWGASLNAPYDVHLPSGAIAWVWSRA
jgi:hypothetical protein